MVSPKHLNLCGSSAYSLRSFFLWWFSKYISHLFRCYL